MTTPQQICSVAFPVVTKDCGTQYVDKLNWLRILTPPQIQPQNPLVQEVIPSSLPSTF